MNLRKNLHAVFTKNIKLVQMAKIILDTTSSMTIPLINNIIQNCSYVFFSYGPLRFSCISPQTQPIFNSVASEVACAQSLHILQ